MQLIIFLGYLSATLLLALLLAFVVYARWHYGVLEGTRGLPVVIPPYFVGGSDPFFYKTVCCVEDAKRVKKYGRVFGMYEGRSPQIFISDPELIRMIFIKDFDHFNTKRVLDYGHPLINEMMDVLPYEKWKVVRNYLSPQLTTGKIKAMSYHMKEAVRDWMDKLQDKMKNPGYSFSAKQAFTSLTTDVIARCAFGTKINTFEDPNSSFVQNIKKLSFDDGEPGLLFTANFTFPFLSTLAPFLPTEVLLYFSNILQDIIQQRRSSKSGRINDFVDVINDMIQETQNNEEYKRLGITETTALSQAMFFLLAGFETTSSTLSLMAYHLAKFPSVQDKLLEEIDAYLARNGGVINHETIGELVYTSATMNETLRLHPPLIRVERVCVKDWSYPPYALEIKEGTTIQVPAFALHYDEEYYPSPETFRPERFLPENRGELNPSAFVAFGAGPHNCIGSRFAKEEILLTMATILREYKFDKVDGQNLVIKKGRLFINNYEDYNVGLVRRDG